MTAGKHGMTRVNHALKLAAKPAGRRQQAALPLPALSSRGRPDRISNAE